MEPATAHETSMRRDALVSTSAGTAWRLDRGPAEARIVLLVHGLGSIAEEIFQAVGPQLLAAGFRVIAIDRPGYGRSEALRTDAAGPAAQADWLAELIGALGIRISVIAAHSFGAAVALCLA